MFGIARKNELSNCLHHQLSTCISECMVRADVVGWMSSMKAILTDIRQGKEHFHRALCIVLLLGCNDPPAIEEGWWDCWHLRPFPLKDAFRFVCVPSRDKFGVSAAIGSLATVSERTEIYSSHGFLLHENAQKSMIRTRSQNRDRVKDLSVALKRKSEKTNTK